MSAGHTPGLAEGDTVLCSEASIDHRAGKGLTGKITGFARFSSYHPREAMVALETGESHWFWVRDLVLAEAEEAA